MTLWPDFGGDGEYGIPYVSVPFTQPLVPISFEVADESDPGPYPMPLDAPVEGGGDRHVLTLRQGDCKLFELYAAEREGSGWHAYSGAVWDLRSNALRPSAGRPPTPPGCRSCPASPAATRPTAAPSATRCGSRSRRRRRPTSTPPRTGRRRTPTPTSRRWACACG